MNLEKLNLVELNAQEVQETEGGFWGAIIVGALVGAALTQDLDRLKSAFMEGYNAGKKP